MPHPNDYTVGWICAITVEYVAAQAFLDEKYDGPDFVSPNDNNDYTLGKIGKHNVVIAISPQREWGLCPAAIVATHMLHSFPNSTIILMVGIGGGVPSRMHDIRLGDIVVSASRGGEGAVFQYDRGKTIQDRGFLQTGFSKEPPPVLQKAVNRLKDKYRSEGHRLEDIINAILEKNSRLREQYTRPDPSSDRLYSSYFIHPTGISCAAVCGDNPSRLMARPERTADEDNPAIHYGLVASANQLMKDAYTRDKLATEKDILCFETEAAGVMNHYPCLVIRGIYYYSDTHKNNWWLGYAAMAAAAYAKELLYQIPLSEIEAEKRIGDIPSGQSKEASVVFPPLEPRHRRNIEIAIICALPREANAVKALFDNCWDDTGQKYGKAKGDPNAYTTGAIGVHNVVLAHLPDMGEINAASAAAYCKTSFENIKLALVVGICGGVPFPKDREEIILGDVVISHGIIQYDFGRQYPDGFKMKDGSLDILPRPSMEIQSLLAKLKTNANRKSLQEKTSKYLSTLHDKLPEIADYPGASEDKLYESAYRHKHYNPFLCGECAVCKQKTDRVCATAINSSCDQLKCSSTKLVSNRRLNEEFTPVIHFGLIASGNTVMKSGEVRDEIATKRGVIAFEMEGAGVWDHFPCLVIKGVCDYADCHKEKKWQNYAAATAAACTKAFLQYWTATSSWDSV